MVGSAGHGRAMQCRAKTGSVLPEISRADVLPCVRRELHYRFFSQPAAFSAAAAAAAVVVAIGLRLERGWRDFPQLCSVNLAASL